LHIDTIGLLLKLLVPEVNAIFSTALAKFGWIMDTTGFSVVLYSRLNLVVQSRKTLHLVLTMIIVDAVLFHTPMIIFLMGISIHKHWDSYVTPFEYTQVAGFSIQETIISYIYVSRSVPSKHVSVWSGGRFSLKHYGLLAYQGPETYQENERHVL
jgi:hypothetical protein